MKSTVTWMENYQSVVDNGRGHQVTIDLPESQNGDNQGATALELAVMSLSGCIATIFATLAVKMRINFTQMEIELEALKNPGDTTISSTNFIFRIKTDEPLEKIEKCLNHTVKTCPVGVLFEKAGIPVNGKVVRL
jgi:putative redox protein